MSKKKFDIVKDGTEIVTDKNSYISLAAVLAFKMFVAPRIPNAYASNAATAILPAIAAGFATQDKALVEKMFVAGLAMGIVPIVSDLIHEIADKKTDPAEKAKLKEIAYAMSGIRPDSVGGVETRVIVDGRSVVAEYQSPANSRIVNTRAMSEHSTSH